MSYPSRTEQAVQTSDLYLKPFSNESISKTRLRELVMPEKIFRFILIILYRLRPFCTVLHYFGSFGPFWTILEPFWPVVDIFGQYRSTIDLCGPFWILKQFYIILNNVSLFSTIFNNFFKITFDNFKPFLTI